MLLSQIESKLHSIEKQGLYRTRLISPSHLLNFSSSDYLSLSGEKEIRAAFIEGFKRYPQGSGSSMLVCGYHEVHAEFEQAMAAFLQVDKALLFPTGFAANQALMAFFKQLNAHVFLDKSLHASFYQGYEPHNRLHTRFGDLADLERKLAISARPPVVITESTFSMNGYEPNLNQLASMVHSFNASLIVDEAHAVGIRGEQGQGGVVACELSQKEVPLRVIPLGKAFAASGALVAGHARWIEYLIHCARSYIYSTGVSPAYTYGLLHTLDFVRSAEAKRHKLRALIEYFKAQIASSSLDWSESNAPIQQLKIGCPFRAQVYSNALKERSILCIPMRKPSVSKKDTGLRVVLNYHHNESDIDYLFECLHHVR